ncbi:MAG TPA: serine protease [Acidimicrobiales bacterium]|nr:serine protease [Acidimicrobiales bacterium]
MRRTDRTASTLAAALVVVLALALAGCGVTEGAAAPGTQAGAAAGAPLDEEGVAALGEESLALVDTPFSSGSAVLVDGGYLITNAHVVDPFDQVALRFADGEELPSVPVVGVDLIADLAVIGPIDTDRPALAVADPDGLSPGDEIHLVGYPGDQEDDLHVEVETGSYVRHQFPEDWGLDYLQANVDIEDGQSGGAMIDDRGRLVGISALGLDDGVALSLSVDDVQEVAAAIEAGTVEGAAADWTPVPQEQGERRHRVELDGPEDIRAFFVSGAAYVDELHLQVSDERARVAVMEPGFYASAASEAALRAGKGGSLWSLAAFDDIEPLELDADGSAVLDIEEGEDLIVLVGSDGADAVDVATSPGSVEVAISTEPRPLVVGDEVLEAVGYLDAVDVYELELGADEEVVIEAESASGDMAFLVAAPGESWLDAPEFDETASGYAGSGGMLGLDEHGTFTADGAGTYTVVAYSVDDTPTAYRLTVSKG